MNKTLSLVKIECRVLLEYITIPLIIKLLLTKIICRQQKHEFSAKFIVMCRKELLQVKKNVHRFIPVQIKKIKVTYKVNLVI